MGESEMTNRAMGYPPAGHGHMPPAQQPYMQRPLGEWSTSLYACSGDCGTFILTNCCPCIVFGQIAEILDEGSIPCWLHGTIYTAFCLGLGLPCLYSHCWRTKMRSKYGIAPGSCGDFCTHFWCECCALHQEYRELQHHGFDPSLGWTGDQRPQMQPTTAPIPPGAMMK